METEPEVFPSPSLETINEQIANLKEGLIRSIMLEGEEEALLIISYSPGLGFYLTARQADESCESVLIDKDLGVAPTNGKVAGLLDVQPRCVFVSEELMRASVEEFYEAGTRYNKAMWREPTKMLK